MNKQFEDRRVQMDLTVVYQRKTYDVRHLLVSVSDIIGVCVQNGVVTFLVEGQEYGAN